MTVNHPITVDLVQPGLTPRLYTMQHDANTRVVSVTLTQAGQPWEAPPEAAFGLSYRKSDGTRGYYTENILPTGSTVSVTLAPQVLTCPGMVEAALVCTDSAGNRIAAFPLQIQVRPDPAAGKTDSDDYFNPADAVRYTPQTLTDAQKAQARANLGLAAGDTWLYNGHRLPPLPVWDKETYPYGVITLRESNGYHYFSVHKQLVYRETADNMGLGPITYFGSDEPGSALLFTWLEGQAAWQQWENTQWSFSVVKGSALNDLALWANFDLLYQDGGLYVAASEPVPANGGAGLRQVTLTTDIGTGDQIGLTESESKLLDAAVALKLPCIISGLFGGVEFSGIAAYINADGVIGFALSVDTYRTRIVKPLSTWMAIRVNAS